MQALAQSTIQDLHNKLAARSAEVEEGNRRLQAARSLAAAEVDGLQTQIEQLTHQLQLQDQRHIQASQVQLPAFSYFAAACLMSCGLGYVCQSVTISSLPHALLMYWDYLQR